jgi:hypothetical protein
MFGQMWNEKNYLFISREMWIELESQRIDEGAPVKPT